MRRLTGALLATGLTLAGLFAGTSAASAGSAEVGAAAGSSVQLACVSVGGGTWCQGKELVGSGLKKCYSQYKHPTKRHSATARMGSTQQKKTANPGQWANAEVIGSSSVTCETFYSANA